MVDTKFAKDSAQLAAFSAQWENMPDYSMQRLTIVNAAGEVAFDEAFNGGHVVDAWRFLTSARIDSKWKTAGILRALRQAFREDRVNYRDEYPDELLRGNASFPAVRRYLRGARARDFAHHGDNTF